MLEVWEGEKPSPSAKRAIGATGAPLRPTRPAAPFFVPDSPGKQRQIHAFKGSEGARLFFIRRKIKGLFGLGSRDKAHPIPASHKPLLRKEFQCRGPFTTLSTSTVYRPLYAPNAGEHHSLIVPHLSLFTHCAPGNAPRRVHSTSTFAIYRCRLRSRFG